MPPGTVEWLKNNLTGAVVVALIGVILNWWRSKRQEEAASKPIFTLSRHSLDNCAEGGQRLHFRKVGFINTGSGTAFDVTVSIWTHQSALPCFPKFGRKERTYAQAFQVDDVLPLNYG